MSIKIMRIAKPMVFMAFAIFGFMREPFIFSMRRKSSRPPSSAGKGSKFMIARFMEISAVKESR